ncbi:MAG: SagB/ThcOx family dehydrogenase [Candidatus Wallbacteria bacterium]|nr:SagB/ThcOx family dehydrogenase [Candidatus Wallbacteria bacterium]
MNKITFFLLFCAITVFAADSALAPIKLNQPRLNHGKLLMEALSARHTERSFATTEITIEVLSDLCWAAFGINRADGKRTAPSAMNKQEIDIYAAMASGLYLYDPKNNQLTPVLSQDLRPLAGKQPFVASVPLCLIYVADTARMGKDSAANDFYSAADTGFISQNVYLYCASEGLVTVVMGMVDKEKLASAMKLRPEQKIILSQAVGWPGK